MVHDRAPVGEIITRINGSDAGFSLYPEDVRSLEADGVPEILIRAMAARQAGETFAIIPASSFQQQPVLQAHTAHHRLRKWVIVGAAAGATAYLGYRLSNPGNSGCTACNPIRF